MHRQPLRSLVSWTAAAVLLLSPLSSTVRGQGPLYPRPTDRFGVGLQPKWGAVTDYDIALLHVGWYSDWGTSLNPPQPNGIDYVQLVWVHEGAFSPTLEQLGPMVDANLGFLWLVGNEPECIWQGDSTPEQYAEVYHQLYGFIKGRDPTAQIAVGGVVEPTPLRLEWLDRVRSHYQSQYGVPMPVDVWNIHIQILQEKAGSYGCEIPRGLEATQGRQYGIGDNANIDIFKQLVAEFRTWMRDRGERDKPLIISEFGVLYPPEYGYTMEQVGDYMIACFDYLLTAKDGDLGYPADENRLVQRWLWYSLNEEPYNWNTGDGFNGALFDYQTSSFPGVLTPVGVRFKAYTDPLAACNIEGSVTLQRPAQAPHPSWSVPLTVTVCSTSYQVTTDESGRFSLPNLGAAKCDVVVKGAHTLSNSRQAVELLPGVNSIDLGTLSEGDANGDDCVNILDFSILATWFNMNHAAADFNEDGLVNISDFSLLAMNFGQCGDAR